MFKAPRSDPEEQGKPKAKTKTTPPLPEPEKAAKDVLASKKPAVPEDTKGSPEKEADSAKKKPTCNKVLVRNLPFTATASDVAAFFTKFGLVDSVNLLQRDGESVGIAFVAFQSTEVAAAAAMGGNGAEFQGRNLTVVLSQAPAQKAKQPPPQENNVIFIGSLPLGCTENSIRQFFADCGNLKSVNNSTTKDGKSRGFAFVEFSTPEATQRAIAMNGMQLDGRHVRIAVAKVAAPKKPLHNWHDDDDEHSGSSDDPDDCDGGE